MRTRLHRLLITAVLAGVVVSATDSSLTSEPGAASRSVPSPGPAVTPLPAGEPLPAITPTPRSEASLSDGFALTPGTVVVAGDHADPAAVQEVRDVLRHAGVTAVVMSAAPARAPVTIWVGGPAETPGAGPALARLGVTGPAGLPAEGYVLAIGVQPDDRGCIVLAGVDATGTYYAAQSFRQVLVTSGAGRPPTVPGLQLRDGPGFAFRGGMEAFYGPDWSVADQLSQLRFLAEHKMDTFVYGPAADPHTGSTWASPYRPDELADLARVVRTARGDHVAFVYRVSPEAPLAPAHGICHTNRADEAALLARLEQLWRIGVRQFVLAWDDVSGRFTCGADEQAFGTDPVPIAAAQAWVVDAVQRDFIDTHPGAGPLLTVPTEYHGDRASPYRTRFDQLLAADVQIYWTGPSVVSPAITAGDLASAQAAFPHHRLALWDNYPVNDYTAERLLLGPLTGRDPGLALGSSGITFNEMQQEEPSLVALSTEADYAWNPAGYQADTAWNRSLRDLGGSAWGALRVLAENEHSSLLDPRESLTLTPLVGDLRVADDRSTDLAAPAHRLAAAFAEVAAAPGALLAGLGDEEFLREAAPWLIELHLVGEAGLTAVDLLLARAHQDVASARTDRAELQAQRRQLASIDRSVAAGTVFALIDAALATSTPRG